tara:strand:+ start:39 stop:356 length:318 start_codon:yes stop_codon:yes gene_type:complete
MIEYIKEKMVLVEWEDSASPLSRWCHLDDLPTLEVIKCVSVGFIVAESDQVLMLAPNIGDSGTDNAQASGCIRIPKSGITMQRGLRSDGTKPDYLKTPSTGASHG